MKIKRFNESTEIKRYLIVPLFSTLGIVEVLDINLDIEIHILYFLVNGKVKKAKDTEPYRKGIDLINSKILYQSDDLEDCKKTLPLIQSVNKYNL